jgi:diadenosine tetraphosphatase ApaH/serine/threonine PP2A family protein phosphatase
MRVAVISDIHANLPALAAVLEAAAQERPDAIWCLGDTVGYGPWPVECCREARGQADVCLVGNHDLGVLGRLDLSDFSPEAATAARWTRAALDEECRAWLASLQPSRELPQAALYHGSPRDPVWEYVLSPGAALLALQAARRPLVLVGHSHVPLAVRLAQGRLEGGHAPAGHEVDLGQGRWLLNPGSVGQPRDGDPRAAWLLLDLAGQRASYRRVPYDVAAAQRAIRRAGLPESLAARLAAGV